MGNFPPIPGNIFITCCMGPILFIISNWLYISFKVNLPLSMASMASASTSSSTISSARSIRVLISPMPNNLDINLSGSKTSRSSMRSPVPINFIGAPISATAERAPPPLADPSSLVITMDPISVVLLNASACSLACWPMVPSMISMTSSGSTTVDICSISSRRSFSSL